jgi:hypothetical protein
MPPGIENLLNYGTLGLVVLCVVYLGYHALLYLFSRDDAKPGYATQMLEAHIENQKAQRELYNALVTREDRQQDLCEKHAATLAEHNVAAHSIDHKVSKLQCLAREACALARTVARNEWPASLEAVEGHCREMERMIDEA